MESAVITADTAVLQNATPTGQGIIESSMASLNGETIGFAPESNVNLPSLDGQSLPSTAFVACYAS